MFRAAPSFGFAVGRTHGNDEPRQGIPMGDVIRLDERRSARQQAAIEHAPFRLRATFYFDLASPFTYLAAERVDRMFPALTWRPALSEALHAGNPLSATADREATQAAAEERALQLHMPLVWPDGYPSGASVAMRVAALAAADGGHAAPFVLAASRLAFCGGFDLDDPEVLAEAAAAAGLGLPEVMAAAGDRSRDGEMEATGLRLLAQGADRLPVLKVGRTLFCGEHRIAEAAAAVRRRPRVESAPTRQVPNAG
jgi:2-hydroxychromene-2-carboxylate isomerase